MFGRYSDRAALTLASFDRIAASSSFSSGAFGLGNGPRIIEGNAGRRACRDFLGPGVVVQGPQEQAVDLRCPQRPEIVLGKQLLAGIGQRHIGLEHLVPRDDPGAIPFIGVSPVRFMAFHFIGGHLQQPLRFEEVEVGRDESRAERFRARRVSASLACRPYCAALTAEEVLPKS